MTHLSMDPAMRVTFADLTNRADLNGKCGVIVEGPNENGRLAVRVLPGNEVVAVLPQNVVRTVTANRRPVLRDPNDECPICTESLAAWDGPAKVKALRCGHGMHYVPCFTRFISNTVGTWVHEPGRVDPNPEVGLASLGLCLSCPVCRDFAPYVFIADSDTTLEFREMVMKLAENGAEITFCEMHKWLRDYKASGLPLDEFMDRLASSSSSDEFLDRLASGDEVEGTNERPPPRTFRRPSATTPSTAAHAFADGQENDDAVPTDDAEEIWLGGEVLASYYY